MCPLLSAHGGGSCFQDPGQSLLCLFVPKWRQLRHRWCGEGAAAPRAPGAGGQRMSACLGAFLAPLPDVHPVLAFLHPVGAPVHVPCCRIRELISHQDGPGVKVPSGPRLPEILFSAVHWAHALVSIIHSSMHWWLLCARPCFQRRESSRAYLRGTYVIEGRETITLSQRRTETAGREACFTWEMRGVEVSLRRWAEQRPGCSEGAEHAKRGRGWDKRFHGQRNSL